MLPLWLFALEQVEIHFRYLSRLLFVKFELRIAALVRHGLYGCRRHDEAVVALCPFRFGLLFSSLSISLRRLFICSVSLALLCLGVGDIVSPCI